MTATDRLRTAGERPEGPLPPSPAADIASAAARVGAYAWLASRLFEVVGGWAASTTEPAAKVHFAAVSRRFAVQASEWHERLPRLREAPRADLVRAPGPSASGLLDAMARATDLDERRAVLRTVLCRLDDVLADHAATLDVVRDGATALTLRRVRVELADLLAAPDRRQEEVPTDAMAVTVDTSEARSGAVVGDIEGRAITGLALFS
jgi:hypothetical protein